MDTQDVLDHWGQDAYLVGDDNNGDAVGVEFLEQLVERVLYGEINAPGGFVEYEEAGVAGEGGGDEYPLLLAAGEVDKRFAQQGGDVGYREDVRVKGVRAGGVAGEEFGDGCGEGGVAGVILREVPDGFAGQVQGYRALLGAVEAEHQLYQGALPRPVGADDGDEIVADHREVGVFEYRAGAE